MHAFLNILYDDSGRVSINTTRALISPTRTGKSQLTTTHMDLETDLAMQEEALDELEPIAGMWKWFEYRKFTWPFPLAACVRPPCAVPPGPVVDDAKEERA
jgi:hypothetical protein